MIYKDFYSTANKYKTQVDVLFNFSLKSQVSSVNRPLNITTNKSYKLYILNEKWTTTKKNLLPSN